MVLICQQCRCLPGVVYSTAVMPLEDCKQGTQGRIITFSKTLFWYKYTVMSPNHELFSLDYCTFLLLILILIL